MSKRTLRVATCALALVGALGCGSRVEAPSTPATGTSAEPATDPSPEAPGSVAEQPSSPTPSAEPTPMPEPTPAEPVRALTSAIEPSAPTRDTTSLADIVAANNRFTAEFYPRVVDPHRNTAVSPYSVHAAFAMAREGARATTREQLDAALHLRGDVTAGMRAFSGRIDAIGRSGVTLRTANRVFLQEGLTVEPTFRGALDRGFGAPFELAPFMTSPEAARARINGWVAGQTNDRIRDLLPPGSVDSDTKLVLTNAMYFLGTWQRAFDPRATAEHPFSIDGGASQRVPMMHTSDRLRYGEVEGARLVELPYTGREIAMVVVVPDARDGLASLLASLDAARLDALFAALRPRPTVEVGLPRFRIQGGSVPLSGAMRLLGVEQAFDPDHADFRGIASLDPPLYVSEAYHQAFVEVNEQGTEAAAATAVVMATRGIAAPEPEPVVIIADRPFLFFLRDMTSGAVLFVGHVVDPR